MTDAALKVLGRKVKDKITGFTGIVVARVEYLSGCTQLCVKPRVKPDDNIIPDGHYIDESRLDIIGDEVIVLNVEDPGGDMADTPDETATI